MDTTMIDLFQRRARRRSFVTGLIVGAVLMFAGLAIASLAGRSDAAFDIVASEPGLSSIQQYDRCAAHVGVSGVMDAHAPAYCRKAG